MEHFFTYILHLSDGTYYTGLTGDLQTRMTAHAKGQSKSTRKKLPATLVWLHQCENRALARSFEVRIKSRGAARFMKTYPTGNHGQIMIEHMNESFLNSPRSLFRQTQ